MNESHIFANKHHSESGAAKEFEKMELAHTKQAVASKGKRKATPPQTLFPDYATAHLSIMSRPGDGIPMPAFINRYAGPERSLKSVLPPPGVRLQSGAKQESPPYRDRSLSIESNSNIACMPLGHEDIALMPLKGGSADKINDWEVGRRSRSMSSSARTDFGHPLRRILRQEVGALNASWLDTISDIISEYEDPAEQHRRSSSLDCLLTSSSATAAIVISSDGGEPLAQADVRAAIGSGDSCHKQMPGNQQGAQNGQSLSRLISSFGFSNLSGKELKSRLPAGDSKLPNDFVLDPSSGILGFNGLDGIAATSSTKRDLAAKKLVPDQYCQISSSDLLDGLPTLIPESVSRDEKVSGYKKLWPECDQRLGDQIQPLFLVAQPHVSNEEGTLEVCNNTNDDTEQDWETVNESGQSTQHSTANILSESGGNSNHSSARKSSSYSPDLEPASLWSPLKPVKAIVHLPFLTDEAYLRPERSFHARTSRGGPIFHTSTPSSTSVAALLPSTTTKPIELFSSMVSSGISPAPKHSSTFPVSLWHRSQASAAIQSSSLFPQSINDKFDLDLDVLNGSQQTRMDKGKGRARDWGFYQNNSGNPGNQQPQIKSDEQPEYQYDEIFEEIHHPSDDEERDVVQNLPHATAIITNAKRNSKILPAITTRATALNRSSSQYFNGGSYSSKLPKPVQTYDFNNNMDVSAFLRATAPAKDNESEPSGSQPINIVKKQGHGQAGQATATMAQESKSHTTGTNLSLSLCKQKNAILSSRKPSVRISIEERLKQMDTWSINSEDYYSRPSINTQGSRKSLGFGAQGFTGVTLSNGDRISRSQQLILYEDNLPEKNTFSFTNRLPPLIQNQSTELMIRKRMDIAGDDWNRLKNECPQFPLRDEHFTTPHPVKKDRLKYERLEKLENGEWLEQAYCRYHHRVEFSATRGLAPHDVATNHVRQQHQAGKLIVFWSCVFFPVGGFLVLKQLNEDRGYAAHCMRSASGDGLIDQPHEDERRLAGLMLEVMTIVWLVVVGGALAACIWALTQMW